MSLTAAWLLELVLVTIAIHLFLRVVRQTRGNRLARGLIVTVLVAGAGLFALTELLELEELGFLLENVTGFVLIALAIVFQPEVRRAISQLGESKLIVGRGAHLAHETIDDIAAAARGLARRRHGALIAIQCGSSLRPYTEKAVSVDAPVTRALLQSIFQPGGMLHDGAVVVRDDRIVAAQCIFPLSERSGLSAFSGTRHRAGLGLSEETDAMVVAVSEETGRITLFRSGERHGPVPPEEVDTTLRELLGHDASQAERPSAAAGLTRLLGNLRADVSWLALAAGVAAVLLFAVHRQLEIEQRVTMTLRPAGPADTGTPDGGELVLRMPDEGWVLAAGAGVQSVELVVAGTRRQIDRSESRLAGELAVDSPTPERLALDLAGIEWRGRETGLRVAWAESGVPEVRLERLEEQAFSLGPDQLPIDVAALDHRFAWDRASTVIRPDQVLLRGPASALAELRGDPSAALLRAVELPPGSRGRVVLRLVLAEPLVARGLELSNAEAVEVELDIRPSDRDAGTIEREIAVGCLDPERAADVDRWSIELHARTARLRIETRGLVPAAAVPGSAAELERVQAIRRFVEDALHVYVDLAELPPDGTSRTLPVRSVLRRNWRESLGELGLDDATLTGEEQLELMLVSDSHVQLTRTEDPASPAVEDSANGNG